MLKIFKIIAFLEGISLLALFGFAMPMKYAFERPEYISSFGMAHGLLFIVYIILATMLKIQENWAAKKFVIICLASVVPFGTFYVENKYLKNA
jgi:integral membrane protein